MDMDIFTTTLVPDEVVAKLGEGLFYTRVGRSRPDRWHGPDYLSGGGVAVDRISCLDWSGREEDLWMPTMDELIARALALIPGELAIVTEFDSVMVDRTAEGEMRYRAGDAYYRPFLVKSLGPV